MSPDVSLIEILELLDPDEPMTPRMLMAAVRKAAGKEPIPIMDARSGEILYGGSKLRP